MKFWKTAYVENWLRRDCFEKRRRKKKLLRFAPGNGCPFLVTIELTTKGLEIEFFIAGILLLMGSLY
jgi:hypothetical protein